MTAVPFTSAEEAWLWTVSIILAQRSGVGSSWRPSGPERPCGPEDIVKCLNTLYERRRISLMHAKTLRIWGERQASPDSGIEGQAEDAVLWKRAMEYLDRSLRARGIVRDGGTSPPPLWPTQRGIGDARAKQGISGWDDLTEAAVGVHEGAATGTGAEIARLRTALTEAAWCLECAEELPIPDLEHVPSVQGLGERIGYGALMTTASALWRKHLQDSGLPAGAEFVCSPCRSQVKGALSKIRAALAEPGQ